MYVKYGKLFLARRRNARRQNMEKYICALKNIQKDEEFKKLYEITRTRYIDNGLNPDDITVKEVINLDFEYFALTYGEEAFLVRKDRGI